MKRSKCVCMWLCASLWYFSTASSHSTREEASDSFSLDLKGSQVSLKREKRSVLGAVVGASVLVNIAGIFMQRKNAEDMAKRYEESMKFQLEQICDAICVTQWNMWSTCSKRCGGGTRKRTRGHQSIGRCQELENFECRHKNSSQEHCNIGCPNGGAPNDKGCSCPPAWKGLCCQQKKICEYPGKPQNGKITGTWPAEYRAVIGYSCNPGYALQGSEDSACLATEKWSRPRPTCERIKCTAPPQKEFMKPMGTQSEYMWGDQVLYRCQDGYTLEGVNVRTCKEFEGTKGRWTGMEPYCEAVKCDDPGIPENGERAGTKFTYNSVVTFSCVTGFRMVGSASLKCLASGRWLGRFPECRLVDCGAPIIPKHGSAIGRKHTYGAIVRFDCEPGYRINGSSSIQCRQDKVEGNWNTSEPFCQAAICGNPGVPDKGSKDGSVYHYPHNISFSCFSGYVLKGPRSIACQADAKWSSVIPTCEACPNNTYMSEAPGVRSCVPCADHTHTLTEASTSRRQCVCDAGYTGPPGGPCEEIRCPVLKAPTNGAIAPCDNRLGNQCTFKCDDGFILDRGTSMRTCQVDGEWDGREPACSACPINTFKEDMRSCLPCPKNSHTNGTASSKKDCQCDSGYAAAPSGEQCIDVNECEVNGGKGPCDDMCENRDGGYQCACSVPGYGIDPATQHTCRVEKQCANLTVDEAPANGGLVCHWFREENSQQCSVKCNNGFEFPSRSNDYESCGSTTNYTWTFRLKDPASKIDPCIAEFFPGFRVEADTSYFVRACKDLTDVEKKQVLQTFADKLNSKGVCKKGTTKVCDIKNMGIICGRVTKRRRRRGVDEEVESVDLVFNVNAFKLQERLTDCDKICPFLRIPKQYCSRFCKPTYKRFLKASVMYAKRQLDTLYKQQKDSMQFAAANREFEPEHDALKTTDVITECDEGMRADLERDYCVPCERGTFYVKSANKCVPCAKGTFQPVEKQTVCVPCPLGTTSTTTGSVICEVCPAGTWGVGCKGTCSCAHGDCDVRSGQCHCHSGWEGRTCEKDVPGCRDGACFPGVTCNDISAPGTGFTCGSCPAGYHGNGGECFISDL